MSREYNYKSEEEFEQELDALIAYIFGSSNFSTERIDILNPVRVGHVKLCADVLSRFVKGEDLSVTCELCEPIQSSAFITLEGKTICMDDTRWLEKVGMLANNMEVYPLTTGGVRMTFMFYGVTEGVQ